MVFLIGVEDDKTFTQEEDNENLEREESNMRDDNNNNMIRRGYIEYLQNNQIMTPKGTC